MAFVELMCEIGSILSLRTIRSYRNSIFLILLKMLGRYLLTNLKRYVSDSLTCCLCRDIAMLLGICPPTLMITPCGSSMLCISITVYGGGEK